MKMTIVPSLLKSATAGLQPMGMARLSRKWANPRPAAAVRLAKRMAAEGAPGSLGAVGCPSPPHATRAVESASARRGLRRAGRPQEAGSVTTKRRLGSTSKNSWMIPLGQITCTRKTGPLAAPRPKCATRSLCPR